jgi:hypothetical protein
MPQSIWTAFIETVAFKIKVASSPDGKTWTPSRYFNQASTNTPALAFYDKKLYLAYTTAFNGNRIFVCTTSDGQCWLPTVFFHQHSKAAPALAAFDGKLFMAYIANDSSNRILYTSFTEANGWARADETGHKSPQSPALVQNGDNLHMVFVSDDGKNAILHCEMPAGGRWGAFSVTDQSTKFPPAIAVFNQDLWVAFLENDNTVAISPSHFSKKITTHQTASSAPSLAAFDNKLFVGFTKQSSAECMVTSSSNPSDAHSWPSSATDIRKQSQPGSGMALAVAPFASGPQPPYSLSCLLVSTAAGTRVYYREQTGLLGEAAVVNGSPQLTAQWPGSSQYPATCGGSITCVYDDGVGARIYYTDPKNNIIELALHQDSGSPTFTRCRETADPHSPLTCLIAGTSGTRVYYLATQNGKPWLNEIAFPSDTDGPDPFPTSFTRADGTPVTPVAAKPNSPLTCVYIPGTGSRVYYLDPNNQIIELALNYLDDSQIGEGLYASFNPTGFPAADGGLTCLLAGSAGTRVYFLEPGSNFVRELSLVNGVWTVTPQPDAPRAVPGSALTSLYIGASRVYYIADGTNEVLEWDIDGGATAITGSSVFAADDSTLTSTYVGGVGSRVYCIRKDNGYVQEICFNGPPGFAGATFSIDADYVPPVQVVG